LRTYCVWSRACVAVDQCVQYSALKAKAPHGEDPIIRIAFKEAYDCARRHLGMWGYYRLDRPQEQQLAALVVER
jgi:hypothetical protein